tara:strand:+ start:53637 stop:54455 length:819 start_codon:yes stop_codon:yes gene_type:complete
MDCQTALEFLDCVRPDSDDLDLPEMADARAHLESCDACQEAFASMQSFDRAVVEVVQDVDVPAGLRSALLDRSAQKASAATDDTPAGNNESGTLSSGVSRRRMIKAAVSVVSALMIGVAGWLWQSQPVQFTEAELLERLPIDLSANMKFDTGFEFALPGPWVGNRQVKVASEILGVDLDDKAGHDAAVTVFRFSRSRNAPIAGILAAIPASRVAPLPGSGSFSQTDAQYIPRAGRELTAAVWREHDTVYVCLVLGSAADLEQIQRNLSTTAA